jgi:hypothetical protein
VADFDHEHAAGLEMRGRFGKDAPHEIETVTAAGERERGFFPVLHRQPPHHRIAHVGRIGDDEVVAARSQFRVQIALLKRDAAAEAVVANVSARDLQCVIRNIGRVHFRARERQREQDGEAARARAQVERAPHAGGGPRREVLAQQLGDVRPRHDDTLVDVEAVLAEPRFVREIRGGLAGTDALFDQRFHTRYV